MSTNSQFQDDRGSFGMKQLSFFSPIASAARKFRKERCDYYESIADRMANAKGKTLRDFFEADAIRYAQDERGRAKKSARAVLSAVWAERYMSMAGDLSLVFQGTLPDEDIALIQVGQQAGSEALSDSFRDLARITGIIQKAKKDFLMTIFVGALAVVLVLFDLILIPTYTTPTILDFFSNIPRDLYPQTAKKFFAFSDFLASNLIFILMFVGMIGWWANWSMKNFVGPWREKIDHFLIWRLYRDFQGAMFVATLSTIIKYRGGASVSLDNALEQLRGAASPYLASHIQKMIDNRMNAARAGLNDGEAVARTLDTGLIDRETMWYLLDVQQGDGIAIGLQKTGLRIEGPTMTRIAQRAVFVRWMLLIMAIVVSIGLAFWQRNVVSALIQAMKVYYSS